MYNLSTLDMQILEVVSQKDFSTIWDVHAQIKQLRYNFNHARDAHATQRGIFASGVPGNADTLLSKAEDWCSR